MKHPHTEIVLTYLLQRVMGPVTLLTEIAPGLVRDGAAGTDRLICTWRESVLALLLISEEIARESGLACADQGIWWRMKEDIEMLLAGLNGLVQHKSSSKDQVAQDCHAILTAYEGIVGNLSTVGQELGPLRLWLESQPQQIKIRHRRSALRMLPMAFDRSESMGSEDHSRGCERD